MQSVWLNSLDNFNTYIFACSVRDSFGSSRPESFLEKGLLTICSKSTGERHGWSPVNLLHIFRTLFYESTSGWLLLQFLKSRASCYHWQDFNFFYFSGHGQEFLSKTERFYSETWQALQNFPQACLKSNSHLPKKLVLFASMRAF